ncbi:hypothetical protein MTIM_34900 [Mycobacterium timonense]|jgi:hypothetical protein|uniref:Uncharacterized protein n=1 Tax=Mycobacterium timonense TaxID=701043 RepID=A0A7I9Z9E3_9MYCO|nr:hypothetical protein MTIM_34900 [Mycobacterium timonense]
MTKVREATRRGIPKRRKLTEKVKAVLMQGDSWHVPDKQIHRWEGEGGAEYLPGPRRRSEY